MKKIAGVIGCIAIVLSITACKWEIPEKISVKTDAEYNFALGKFDKDLNEEMGISALLGASNANDVNITRYDYFPGKEDKNVQHFLVEVKVLDHTLIPAENVETAFGSAGSKTAAELSITSNIANQVGLDFSPIDILNGMSEAMGTDIVGKVSFANVPIYFFCEVTEGLSANASFGMFYGSKENPVAERSGTRTNMYNAPITSCAKPAYVFENDTVIISDLEKKSYSAKIDITDIMNNRSDSIQENDQLCIDYLISSISGSVSKAAAQNGIKIAIYAAIDIPLQFTALEDIKMNLNDFAGSLDGAETPETPDTSAAKDSEFSKYLKVVEAIRIKYDTYKLPLYTAKKREMQLGVDMIGKGNYDYAEIHTIKEGKDIPEEDRCHIDLRQSTIEKIKETGVFIPNFQLKIVKDALFSVPRDKGVKVNLELSLKTDGTVAVK